MFTLAAAVGARALARQGVLPTRLSAVDEAGSIDILCSDKTGTLTRNELAVTTIHSMPGYDDNHVSAFAGLASSDGGQDWVDVAIRAASAQRPIADSPNLVEFFPLDPAMKRAEATVRQADGAMSRIVKGAFSVDKDLAQPSAAASAIVDQLQAKGFRVLAVACGATSAKLDIVGLIALSAPPRADSAALVAELSDLGVRTIMVTGDAQVTAEVVAGTIGISGPVWATTPLPENIEAEKYALFAGVGQVSPRQSPSEERACRRHVRRWGQ